MSAKADSLMQRFGATISQTVAQRTPYSVSSTSSGKRTAFRDWRPKMPMLWPGLLPFSMKPCV